MKVFSDNLDQISIKSTFRINFLYSCLILIEEGFFVWLVFWAFLVCFFVEFGVNSFLFVCFFFVFFLCVLYFVVV